ncbi:MAG: Prolipoprotein diacylglyceryl transferase [Alphaproteobacteria bacterium MarineAlpha4_Bin2]|nr:MAG: Prolipoprotein diacylglyceryl transferase [Alphaproteobacteria bacterium MarineAlpha4_Bin2]
MEFPNIDPIALQFGPVVIRWYALAYIAGLLIGWRYCIYLSRFPPKAVTPPQLDDFLIWATLGIVLGGRFGYVLFYQPIYFLQHPLEILQMWKGGMSFHGGLLGLIFGAYVFARRHTIPILRLFDLISAVGPIGLFFGRIANFINGELWGRTTDVSWGIIFPRAGPLPRHPSQLYEAALEGLLLVALSYVLIRRFDSLRRPGTIFGVFLVGYGVARIVAESVREPDEHIGLLVAGTTWGQWLSVPMVLLGSYMVWRALRRDPVASG